MAMFSSKLLVITVSPRGQKTHGYPRTPALGSAGHAALSLEPQTDIATEGMEVALPPATPAQSCLALQGDCCELNVGLNNGKTIGNHRKIVV